jgi:transcriptional regulator with XRE-family HTH domain
MEKKIHQGKNITRFRNMFGIKQDTLASIMGDDWTQMKISRLEAKEEIEPDILQLVANALKMPVEAFTKFDEDAAISIIANTITEFKDQASVVQLNHQPTFNPVDKIVEILERTIAQRDQEIKELKKELKKRKK